ncbi:MAG TPA: flagellar assembly protein FliW [Spirochaetia bacterium]|nr:flagellar assembly protein FliW [Spirochaetia bacterium]
MNIDSKAYGPIEINERQVIDFRSGIFGFSDLHDYALLDAVQPGFYWLQSLDDPEIAFIMLNPYDLRPDYVLEIPDEDLASLEYDDPDDILVFAIVTIPEDEAQISANLQGPIVINRAAQLGRQSISLDPRWKTKHIILEELAEAGSR